MKHILLILFLLPFCFLISGCHFLNDSTSVNADRSSDVGADQPSGFETCGLSNDDIADSMFEGFMHALDSKQRDKVCSFFSKNTLVNNADISNQVQALFNFYDGDMISYNRSGPGVREFYEGEVHTKEIIASYDVTTTSCEYRIAIKMCIIDSTDSDNIGIQSVYIIKAANSDLSFTYWGGHTWASGITIQYQDYPDETQGQEDNAIS